MTLPPPSLPHRGLQRRLLGWFVAGALPVVLVAGGFAYHLEDRRSDSETRRTLQDLVSAVERTVQIGAYSNDTVLLGEVAGGLVHHPRLQRVLVQAADGQVLVDLSRPVAAAGAAAAPPLQISHPLASPFDAREVIGRIELTADPQARQRAAREGALRLAAALMAQTLLVAVLLYAVVARLVSGPIVRIAEALRGMSPGTAARLPVPAGHQRDELGQLVGGANALLQASEQALVRERALRAEIEAMEAQYRQIFDSSSAGIFVLTPEGRLVNSNPTALRVVGWPAHGEPPLREADFLQAVFAQPQQMRAMIDRAMAEGRTLAADLELQPRDQAPRWVHCLVSPQRAAGAAQDLASPTLVEAVMYDVTERIRGEHAARRQAELDPLTGLLNRAGFLRFVEPLLARAPASLPLALLYIDLDGFKRVNDELGHAAGDQVLLACALRMKHLVRRGSDSVARLGGDEFVVVADGLAPDDPALARLSAQLLHSLCEPVSMPEGRQARLGASIGIAVSPHHGLALETLLAAADAAMYEVKRTGKNSFAMAGRQ